MKRIITIVCIAFTASCSTKKDNSDASGIFEATEIVVSAEATGVIKALSITEGESLSPGQVVGYIDTTALYLRKKQLLAQLTATGARMPDIKDQTAFYKQQAEVIRIRLEHLEKERQRTENLIKADAATGKQLDDITAQINEARTQLLVIGRQDEAQVSALQTQSSGLRGDRLPLNVQIEQVEDQLARCRITNPVKGTVLAKYSEPAEMAMTGKPLYKIADVSSLILKAYITGDQLPAIKINQQVAVMTDSANGKYRTHTGIVEWVSDKAEFTPKTIQTKDERANLVYATRIRVRNDGSLKIGMYGEIKLK